MIWRTDPDGLDIRVSLFAARFSHGVEYVCEDYGDGKFLVTRTA